MTPKKPMLLRGRPQCAKPRPTRADCERIAKQVAEQRGITFDDLIYSSRPDCRTARAETWAKVIAEIGCSAEALGEVWGVSKWHVLEMTADYRQEQAA